MKVIVCGALEVIPKLEGPFDLVFIDAEKSDYLDYLWLIEDKIHRTSVIVADNAGIFAEKMRDYLCYIRSWVKYRSKYVTMGEDGLEISIKL